MITLDALLIRNDWQDQLKVIAMIQSRYDEQNSRYNQQDLLKEWKSDMKRESGQRWL